MESEGKRRRTLPGAAGRTLAEQILASCLESGSAAGDRLPTERRLALDLGVTRTVVRNALSLLEADGRVSREIGRGTFLRVSANGNGAPPPADRPPRPDAAASRRVAGRADDVGPADVMAVRRLIEPQALSLVVAWATARDFDEMERCLDGGDRAGTSEEFEAWDFALHHAIVVAAHNQLLLRMYAAVETARHGQIWGNMKRRNDSSQRRAVYQEEHRVLVEALRARGLDRAIAAMDDHLARVTDNLLGLARATSDHGTG